VGSDETVVGGSEVRRLFAPATPLLDRGIIARPNSEPHLMMARAAIIDSDMHVASFRKWVETRDLHFFPAPTYGQFSAARNQ
jgi:hypothetical protein